MNSRKKKYKINKLRMLSALIVISALIAISVSSVYGFVSSAEELSSGNVNTDYIMIEVAEGDSLWSIARSCGTKGSDLRKTVETICSINMLKNSMIYPGQVLLIPDA